MIHSDDQASSISSEYSSQPKFLSDRGQSDPFAQGRDCRIYDFPDVFYGLGGMRVKGRDALKAGSGEVVIKSMTGENLC